MRKRIFESVEVGGLKLKNRLVRSATWEDVATPGGGIDEVTYGIYDELARGGVGLVITGFTSMAKMTPTMRMGTCTMTDDMNQSPRKESSTAPNSGEPTAVTRENMLHVWRS